MASLDKPNPITKDYLEEYAGDRLVAVCALFIVLETIFVALRYHARHLTIAGLGWDDALIPATWLTNMGLCSTGITAVYTAGAGRHIEYIMAHEPQQFQTWAKCLYAVEWLYISSTTLPKVSILCLYLRIFVRRDARSTCYVLLGFLAVTWFAYVTATNLQCRPLAYRWDKSIVGGRCVDFRPYYKAASAPNIFTDVVMMALPIPTVLGLQTTAMKKTGLLVVFLTGSIGLIGSCFRMASFFTHDLFTDSTWSSVPLMQWTVIEPGMYLLAACMLTMRPLVRQLSPEKLRSRLTGSIIFGSLSRRYGSGGNGDSWLGPPLVAAGEDTPSSPSCLQQQQPQDRGGAASDDEVGLFSASSASADSVQLAWRGPSLAPEGTC